jgi:hypothetical protein
MHPELPPCPDCGEEEPRYCAACGERLGSEDRAEGARGIIHAGCWEEALDDPGDPSGGQLGADERWADGPVMPAAYRRPAVTLSDGNAYAILAACDSAAREAGWSAEERDAFRAEATSGDYDHLLRTVLDRFDADLHDPTSEAL